MSLLGVKRLSYNSLYRCTDFFKILRKMKNLENQVSIVKSIFILTNTEFQYNSVNERLKEEKKFVNFRFTEEQHKRTEEQCELWRFAPRLWNYMYGHKVSLF